MAWFSNFPIDCIDHVLYYLRIVGTFRNNVCLRLLKPVQKIMKKRFKFDVDFKNQRNVRYF